MPEPLMVGCVVGGDLVIKESLILSQQWFLSK